MKIKLIKHSLSLFLFLGVISCLPVQKETQCGRNEAFNATQRRCLPVLGSASTNTVFLKSKAPENSYATSLGASAVEHSVSVSDVYNYGYSTKWNLRFISTVDSSYNFSQDNIQVNTLSYNFLPASPLTPYLAGSYIIECVLYDRDANVQLDSVSWSVQVGQQVIPQLENPTPAGPSVTFASNSNLETLSIDINNPDAKTGTYTWFVNGVQRAGPTVINTATNPANISFIIDPENELALGINYIQVRMNDLTNPTVSYDAFTWTVFVNNPNLPQIASSSPAFSSTLIAIDGVSYTNRGYFDSSYTALNDLASPGLCVTVDNFDKDGDTIGDLDYSIDISGQLIASSLDLGSNTVCANATLTAQNLVNPSTAEPRTVTFTTYIKGTATIVEQRQWAMTVMPKNTAPRISIRFADSDLAPTCNNLSDGDLSATECQMTQSVDDNKDGTYDINNSRTVSINVQDFETYSVAANSAHGEDNIEVIFQIKKEGDASFQDLDANSIFSVTDCILDAGQTNKPRGSSVSSGMDASYNCTFGVNAFNLVTDESLESGDYIVKAFVRDAGSTYAPGNIQESNHVTWKINVSETQTPATVQPQLTAGAPPVAAVATNSYIVASDATCTNSGPALLTNAIAAVNENDYIKVHTVLKDFERDNLKIYIALSNAVSGGESVVYPTTIVSETYNPAGFINVESCFQIPEWAVDGASASNGVVTITPYIVEVTDGAPVGLPPTSDETFEIMVGNDNPLPQFADSSTVTLSPNAAALDPGNDIIVFSGHPFEIAPPAYTDASVFDGRNVTWQWQICIGAACSANSNYTGATDPNGQWVNLSNANNDGNPISPTLLWTPNPTITAGSNVNLRICLGDDGGNPRDCTSAATSPDTFKVYQNIKVFPSQVTSPGFSGAELATWYDSSDDTLYSATTSGTKIIATKFSRSETAGSYELEQVHQIEFFSEDPTKTSGIPTELSMSGIEGESLYIAYKVEDQVSSAPQIRVRRIELAFDKFSFNYNGLYTNDPTDLVLTDVQASTNYNANVIGNGGLQIAFPGAGIIVADSLEFRLADGSNPIVNFCGGGCANDVAAADDLFNTITNTALFPNLNKEFEITRIGGTVTITGPPSLDYQDFGGISLRLGDIVTDAVQDRWYVPYGSTNSLNIFYGGNASDVMTSFVPASQIVAGSTNSNTEIASSIDRNIAPGARILIATKSSSGNLNVYRVDAATFALLETVPNIFNFNGNEEVFNLAISSGGTNHDIYVLVKNENYTTNEVRLGAAVLSGLNPSAYATNKTFNDTNFLAQTGIENIKVAGHPGEDGYALIAATTNSTHLDIPNEAHLFRLRMSDVVAFTGAPVLAAYKSSSTNLTSPKLNTDIVANLDAIAITPIFPESTLTIGHENTASLPATQDSSKPFMFFSFHESNGAKTIIHGQYNINSENMSTDSVETEGSFPSFVEN